MSKLTQWVVALQFFGCMLPIFSAEPLAETRMHKVAAPGGWAKTPDGMLLYVGQPKSAELLTFDSESEQLIRRIELDFAPGPMFYLNETLYIAGDGAGIVYAINPKNGEIRDEYYIRGTEIQDLAGHPQSSTLYAATSTFEIFAINLKSGKSLKTKGQGNRVVMHPTDPKQVFTGVKRNDTREVFLIESDREEIRIIWDRWGPRSGILGYAANENGDLKLITGQGNATVNGYFMAITPDGRRIMMTGGGGWRPPADVSGTGGYYTAVFSTRDLETMVGKAPSGSNLEFHPVLKIAVTNSVGRDLILFDSRSYVERKKIHLADGADMRPLLLTFVAKGTKIAVWNGDNPQNPREGLHFVSLQLEESDLRKLAAKYGKLPERKSTLARSNTEKMNVKNGKTASGSYGAIAGFNSKNGLGISSRQEAQYRIGASNGSGGSGEPGWNGPWPSLDKAEFQNKTVFEGDGALHLRGTSNFARGFTRSLAGKVKVEHHILIPPDGNLSCYIWEKSASTCGPMWRVAKSGTIEVLNGNARGSGNWTDTGVHVTGKDWIKVVQAIDCENKTWRFEIPGEGYKSDILKYRGNPKNLLQLNYLAESPDGAYIDAIQVSQQPDKQDSLQSE